MYQTSNSTPSTSSAENSGSTAHVDIKRPESDLNTEDYYNLKNENDYYNQSITSLNSDVTADKFSATSADIQLRLQDEPLYQFYDAAVLDVSIFEISEGRLKIRVDYSLFARMTAPSMTGTKKSAIRD